MAKIDIHEEAEDCFRSQIAALRKELEEAQARIAELEATVEKLPCFKDGARATLGDWAWYPFDFYDRPREPVEGTVVESEDSEGGQYAVQLMLPGNNPAIETLVEKPVGECYSSLEAARQAIEESNDEHRN